MAEAGKNKATVIFQTGRGLLSVLYCHAYTADDDS